MNSFETFFQKPEGFIWSDDLQCYYEHEDRHFKYPLEAIGEFNLKWQGWLAACQIMQAEPGELALAQAHLKHCREKIFKLRDVLEE